MRPRIASVPARASTPIKLAKVRAQTRSSSSDESVSAPYSPKVRAFPFRYTPEAALNRMGIAGALFGTNLPALIPSLLARLLPMFGTAPLTPLRMKAVYLPVWLVDCAVEATIWAGTRQDGDPIQRTATASMRNLYIPGFSWPPLSKISLNSDVLTEQESQAVPVTPEVTEGVVCLPFSLHPDRLFDAARSLSFSQAVVSPQLRFDPGSVRVRELAAYPVLTPIYIAEYENLLSTEDEQEVVTIVMDALEGEVFAYDGKGPLHSERMSARTFLAHCRVYLGGPGVQDSDALSTALIGYIQSGMMRANWADAAPSSGASSSSSSLAEEAEEVDMEETMARDIRVRPLVEDERRAYQAWYQQFHKLQDAKHFAAVLDAVESSPNARVFEISLGGSRPKSQSQAQAQSKPDSQTQPQTQPDGTPAPSSSSSPHPTADADGTPSTNAKTNADVEPSPTVTDATHTKFGPVTFLSGDGRAVRAMVKVEEEKWTAMAPAWVKARWAQERERERGGAKGEDGAKTVER